MIVYFQWATASPRDWTAVNIRSNQQIRSIAKKSVPKGHEALDDTPGWLLGVNCQGINFTGYDHISIQILDGDGLRLTGWQDDPIDFPPGTRYAVQWDLMPPAFDPKVKQINTVQERTLWAEPDAGPGLDGALPWGEFTPPLDSTTFHGIWVSDELFYAHLKVRSRHGWREWIT